MIESASQTARASGQGANVNPVSPAPSAPPTASGALAERPEVDPAAAGLITADVASRLKAMPYAFAGARVLVAMADPADDAAADEISVLSGRPVTRRGIKAEWLDELLRTSYGATAQNMAEPRNSTTITAQAPSFSRLQSNRRNGSAIQREAWASATSKSLP